VRRPENGGGGAGAGGGHGGAAGGPHGGPARRGPGPVPYAAGRGERGGLLHGFRPGRALVGLAALTVALLYGGDAAGAWHTPWFVALPVVAGGLLLAAAVGGAAYVWRRRRAAIRASSESSGAPASTSGSQAIK
jgi:hypothetical protein